nr:MAG TPA: hypothetical protein [Bacteriophage sp.]
MAIRNRPLRIGSSEKLKLLYSPITIITIIRLFVNSDSDFQNCERRKIL